MSKPLLTAKHIGNGVWEFECPLHDPDPFGTRGISSPRHARSVLKAHLDKEHPGTTARLRIISDYSGSSTKYYTSPENVKTGDLL